MRDTLMLQSMAAGGKQAEDGVFWHMQDFHSAIEGALSNEEYVRELREAMLEEAAAELAAGEERAAQSALRKAELKVWS